MAAPFLLLLFVACIAESSLGDVRHVVLQERFGFLPGRSVNVTVAEVPGIRKMVIAACRDMTLSQCQGFALDGRYIRGALAAPATHKPADVFAAFFGRPYESSLFAHPDSNSTLEPHFIFNHLESGTYELESEPKGIGWQKSLYVPRPITRGYSYLFVGAEVKLGVSDPIGTIEALQRILEILENREKVDLKAKILVKLRACPCEILEELQNFQRSFAGISTFKQTFSQISRISRIR